MTRHSNNQLFTIYTFITVYSIHLTKQSCTDFTNITHSILQSAQPQTLTLDTPTTKPFTSMVYVNLEQPSQQQKATYLNQHNYQQLMTTDTTTANHTEQCNI